ncbi:MAG: hypothetical protein AB7G21_08060 [Dehalococcoidia bacterium]
MPASTSRTSHRRRTASQLVASGEVTREQVYAATLALARLHDRGVGFTLGIEDMCEVLGYLGASRRPHHVTLRPRRSRVA